MDAKPAVWFAAFFAAMTILSLAAIPVWAIIYGLLMVFGVFSPGMGSAIGWGATYFVVFTPPLVFLYFLARGLLSRRMWGLRTLQIGYAILLVSSPLLMILAATQGFFFDRNPLGQHTISSEMYPLFVLLLISSVGVYLFGFNKDVKALFSPQPSNTPSKEKKD